MNNTRANRGAIRFGLFRLVPSERLLECDGVPVSLGGRALDILIALTELPGSVWNKKDLIARAWPDVSVEDGNLRVQIAALRKALGEGEGGARYVVNVAGRGYGFVATIDADTASDSDIAPIPGEASVAETPHQARPFVHPLTLPNILASMVGRVGQIEEIITHLGIRRILTIIGPGGIGKTTVAIATAHSLVESYCGAVYFVDFSALNDPGQVAGAVATALGLVVQASDITQTLLAHLSNRKLLFIFDNCEHLIGSVAELAERTFEQAPHVAILATSREALRIQGEQIFILPPLETPPPGEFMTMQAVLSYSAAQLFIDRVAAGGCAVGIDDQDAHIVADICRKLDGMALAIELAAGRVAAYGIRGTADLLDSRIRFLWHGRRTSPQRQQTLRATLDWSYNLLEDVERRILDRLSIFVGTFDVEAVGAVVADEYLDRAVVLEILAELVGKSLLTTQLVAGEQHYRLLQTTRAYVREKAVEREDFEQLSRRHALYFADFLERSIGGPGPSSETRSFEFYGGHIGNVRAALEWTLTSTESQDLAVRLGAAAVALFLELSLLGECEAWSRRVLQCLDASTTGSVNELKVQAAHGLSLMFTRGNGTEVMAALTRGVELARIWNDPHGEIQILGVLNTFYTRISAYAAALATAWRCEELARAVDDPDTTNMAHWMLGTDLMLAGDQGAALSYCESALQRPRTSTRLNTLYFGYDQRLRTMFSLALCLWLRGLFDRSVDVARQAISESEALDHPLTKNQILIYTLPIFIWKRDWASAETMNERQLAHAEKYGLGPYRMVGSALAGEIAIRSGHADTGVQRLKNSIPRLRAERHNLQSTVFLCALADGLAALGDLDGARAASAEAMSLFEEEGESYDVPEILRVRAKYLIVGTAPDPATAETLLLRALDIARRQCSVFWEIRVATDLATLWAKQGRRTDAVGVLEHTYSKFDQGFDLPELVTARSLLATI